MEVKHLSNVFLCENAGHYFFYDGSTGFISETSCMFNDVISAFCKYDSIDDVKEALVSVYNSQKVDSMINEVVEMKNRGIIFNNKRIPVIRCADIPQEEWEEGNVLENLILNISHECNMRCKYCFADHGHFCGKATVMSKKNCKR